MKQKKYAVDQILTKLREVDRLCKRGKTVQQALECIEVSEDTYYRWRKKYGWLTGDEYRRMKELENENAKLKSLIQLWVTTMGEQNPIIQPEEGTNSPRSYFGQ